jgi:hypothetical protein
MSLGKKGSLNLSTNAIVILILAIVVLGLGLAFMRNIFGSATEEFGEVEGTVRQQMINQMKDSENLLELSAPLVSMGAGTGKQIFLGFTNLESGTVEFTMDTVSSQGTALDGVNNCNLAVSGVANEVYLEYKGDITEVLKGDVVVLPLNIKTESDAKDDVCFYELVVDYETTSGSCADGVSTTKAVCEVASTWTPDVEGTSKIELTVDVVS